jgi:hypothetical protein
MVVVEVVEHITALVEREAHQIQVVPGLAKEDKYLETELRLLVLEEVELMVHIGVL